MSAFPSAEEQLEILHQFKEAIQAKGKFNEQRHTDQLLNRFLRARKFDLEKTEEMFFNCEEWRASIEVENIVQTFTYNESEEVFDYYPRFYHKTDKLGRSVYYEQLKNLDVDAMFRVTTQDRFITRHVRELEKFVRYRLPAVTAARGPGAEPIEKGVTILDLKGVPLSQFNQVRKVIQSISKISSDYYPEHMGKMIIINSPTLFTAIWSVIRAMIDEATAAKISIVGSNYQKTLLELIDADKLPKIFGGTCECEGGCEHSDAGPWNDGSAPGFPQSFWEDFRLRDKGLIQPSSSGPSPQ